MKPDAPKVKRLQRRDLSLFRQMNELFATCFDDPKNYRSNPPSDSYLYDLLEKESVIAVVTTVDSKVVGGLVAYELEKFEQARREIYIYDLAVNEPHRRKGLATLIIEKVRKIARSRNSWVVYVQADYGDEPAIALYSKIGQREDVLHFDIEP